MTLLDLLPHSLAVGVWHSTGDSLRGCACLRLQVRRKRCLRVHRVLRLPLLLLLLLHSGEVHREPGRHGVIGVVRRAIRHGARTVARSRVGSLESCGRARVRGSAWRRRAGAEGRGRGLLAAEGRATAEVDVSESRVQAVRARRRLDKRNATRVGA